MQEIILHKQTDNIYSYLCSISLDCILNIHNLNTVCSTPNGIIAEIGKLQPNCIKAYSFIYDLKSLQYIQPDDAKNHINNNVIMIIANVVYGIQPPSITQLDENILKLTFQDKIIQTIDPIEIFDNKCTCLEKMQEMYPEFYATVKSFSTLMILDENKYIHPVYIKNQADYVTKYVHKRCPYLMHANNIIMCGEMPYLRFSN